MRTCKVDGVAKDSEKVRLPVSQVPALIVRPAAWFALNSARASE